MVRECFRELCETEPISLLKSGSMGCFKMFPIDNLLLLCAMLTYIGENAQIVILGAVRHVLLHNQAACLWRFLELQ